MKYCPRCEETKPLDHFHREAGRKDGRKSWCADCTLAYHRERYTGDKRARARQRAELEKVRCLHGQCMRPGKDQPEGLGFRFCDIHVHHARKVLDNPTRAWSPAGYALPTKGTA